MNAKILQKSDWYFISIIIFGIWATLLWDHFHGGVPSHYLLHDKDMPSISNWWGGLILPLLSLLIVFRIRRNIRNQVNHDVFLLGFPKVVITGFISALLFGILLSFTFLNYMDLTGYLALCIFPMALFFPLHKGEYLLGFVIGMTYTFGVFIPTGFGLIMAILCALLYKFIRPGFLFVFSKTKVN